MMWKILRDMNAAKNPSPEFQNRQKKQSQEKNKRQNQNKMNQFLFRDQMHKVTHNQNSLHQGHTQNNNDGVFSQ